MTIVEEAVKYFRSVSADIATKTDYYNGDHAPVFSTSTVGVSPLRTLYDGLIDNQCRNVVDLTVDGLEVTGFAPVEQDDELAQAFAQRAWDLWQRDRMSARIRDWLIACETAGKPGGIVTWFDSKGVAKNWLQTPAEFAFKRSEENPDMLEWAVKKWWDGSRACLTVYTPEQSEIWRAHNDKSRDPEPAAYKLIEDSIVLNPFGEVTASAPAITVSDLDSVIPLNDALNQTLANAAVTDSYYAQHLRVWMGLELEPDPDNPGKFIEPFQLGDKRSVFLPPAPPGEQPTDVKDMPGQSSAPLMQAANEYRYAIARNARIPMFMIMQDGNIPSGESLRVSSSAFTGKKEARQGVYGSPIADAQRRQTAIDMGLSLEDAPQLITLWKPAAPESLEMNAKVGQALADIGVPVEVILTKIYGWDAETAQAVADSAANARLEAETAQARVFDAGGNPAGM